MAEENTEKNRINLQESKESPHTDDHKPTQPEACSGEVQTKTQALKKHKLKRKNAMHKKSNRPPIMIRSSSNPEISNPQNTSNSQRVSNPHRKSADFTNTDIAFSTDHTTSLCSPSPLATTTYTKSGNPLIDHFSPFEFIEDLDPIHYALQSTEDEENDEQSLSPVSPRLDVPHVNSPPAEDNMDSSHEKFSYPNLHPCYSLPSCVQSSPRLFPRELLRTSSEIVLEDDYDISSGGGDSLEDEKWLENGEIGGAEGGVKLSEDFKQSLTGLHSQDITDELKLIFQQSHLNLADHQTRSIPISIRNRSVTESSFVKSEKMLRTLDTGFMIPFSTDDDILSDSDEDKLNPELKSVKKLKKRHNALKKMKNNNMSPRTRKNRAISVVENDLTQRWGSSMSPVINRKEVSQLRRDTYNFESLVFLSQQIPPLEQTKKKVIGSPQLLRSPKANRSISAVQKPKRYKLHNPKSAEKLLKHLKANKFDQVERDENKDTPLHAIIRSERRDKLECLIILMVHSDYGADNIDLPAQFGNTALHLAVQRADLQIIKLLLIFGANIDAINEQNKTPLDFLINKGGDKKFLEVIELLKSLDAKHGKEIKILQVQNHQSCSHLTRLMSISVDHPELQERLEPQSTTFGKPRALSSNTLSPIVLAQKLEINLNDLYTEYDRIPDIDMQFAIGLQQFELQGWKVTSSSALKFQVQGGSRLLFLDGGGIRGLIQIEILSMLEHRTGRKITELFDWIIGTSTGGIVALGLVYGKKSLSELRQFYFKLKEEIFAKPGFGFAYNTEALENILKEILGSDAKMSDVKEPKVLVSAVFKKTTNLQLNFFNNCFDDEFSDHLVWKVARYTSAAPMHFSELDHYVDGGVLANNPSDYGLTAIQNFHRQQGRKLDIACVVSVGTGTSPAEALGSTDAHEMLFNVHSLKKRATNLLTLLTKALVESEDVAKNCRSRCQEQHIPFYRFCPNLEKEVASSETDNSCLIDMLMTTKYQAIEEWTYQIDELLHIFTKIEEFSRKETIEKLRLKRRQKLIKTNEKLIQEEDEITM